MEVDEVVAHSTRNIENIDLEDMNDPQLVSEYVNEIYGYMRELEEKQSVRKNYLDKHKVTAGKYIYIKLSLLSLNKSRFHKTKFIHFSLSFRSNTSKNAISTC